MRIREEIWMKANPLSGGSSCMEELTWIVGQGTNPLLSHLLAGCRWIRGGNEWNFTTRLKVKELNYQMERISAIQMSNLPIPVLGLICCALFLSFIGR